MNSKFDIYLCGVGGQGIGLLSETIVRAANYAGITIHGTDTHGLAQRGGMVSSFIRLGENIHSPLIMKHTADMVIALEIHEALRGSGEYLKPNGILVYYNAVWQPLPVRTRQEKSATETTLLNYCTNQNIKTYKAYNEQLTDARMQNMVLLSVISKNKLINGITTQHYLEALKDLLPAKLFEENLKLL